MGLHFSECEVNWNLVFSHYKSGHHFAENCHTTKLLISDPQVLLFQVSTETEYCHQALWKMLKWLPFCRKSLYSTIPYCWLSQMLDLWFSESWQKWNIGISHYHKMDKWLPFHEKSSYSKILNYEHAKVWVSTFPSGNGNGLLASVIMKKWKIVIQQNFFIILISFPNLKHLIHWYLLSVPTTNQDILLPQKSYLWSQLNCHIYTDEPPTTSQHLTLLVFEHPPV